MKCAVRVDCATVHAAALGEAAGYFLSHPLRLMMRLHAEEVALTAARLADVTETKVPAESRLSTGGGRELGLHVRL